MEEDMTARHFFSGFQKVLSYYLTDLRAAGVAEQVAILLFRYARHLKFYGVSVSEQAASIRLLEAFIAHSRELEQQQQRRQRRQGRLEKQSQSQIPGLQDVLNAAYTMLSSLHSELGEA